MCSSVAEHILVHRFFFEFSFLCFFGCVYFRTRRYATHHVSCQNIDIIFSGINSKIVQSRSVSLCVCVWPATLWIWLNYRSAFAGRHADARVEFQRYINWSKRWRIILLRITTIINSIFLAYYPCAVRPGIYGRWTLKMLCKNYYWIYENGKCISHERI